MKSKHNRTYAIDMEMSEKISRISIFNFRGTNY